MVVSAVWGGEVFPTGRTVETDLRVSSLDMLLDVPNAHQCDIDASHVFQRTKPVKGTGK